MREAAQHRQGQLIVGAHDGVGLVVAREEPFREADALGLFDRDAHRLGRLEPALDWARRNPS